ncbi:MAG: sulfite exporter TauE/SafE family protein [Clostridia bacterium]|nr:sulfite exporter TauE/SafE family protein [Clostridia bacterium]
MLTALERFLVYIIASIGAGIGVGLTGMSAAVVISPMLITFLKIPAYDAVGIALAADVPAAAVSAITYGRNKNIDLRAGVFMLASVIVFTFIGSGVASFVHNKALGSISVIWTFVLGLRFLLVPLIRTREKAPIVKSNRQKTTESVLWGAVIGFVCGFVGAGGGMMLLLVLTVVLGYDTKTAVGTSVFIMAFSASTGAISHFLIGGVHEWFALITCSIVTLIVASITSKRANRWDSKRLNFDIGILLVTLGIAMMLIQFL